MEFALKVLVCVVGVLVIAGNHGDASIDNLLLTKTTNLLEDNIKSEDAKLCHRPCKINVKPKRCHFKLTVSPSATSQFNTAIAVNDTVPGPAIHVCANDIVVAEVTNKVPTQDITIHWHGVDQRGTPYMDGVPMITQCPIGYGATYKYAFRASTAGTYFYHANSVVHQADGVFGALIVSQPSPLEPNSALYDYDRKENVLLLSALFPELLTANLNDLTHVVPSALNINGLNDLHRVFVSSGFGYRVRLINAVSVECPLTVSVDAHRLLAIATDGHPVQPMSTHRLLLYPGERMDVVLKADQPVSGYWLRVKGLGACAGLETKSAVIYSGYNYTAMMLESLQPTPESNSLGVEEPLVQGQMLRSLGEAPKLAVDRQVVLAIDRNAVPFKDTDNDFRYISDAIPKKPFFPSQLTTREGFAVQINGKNFLYPNFPILTQPKDVNPGLRCDVGAEYRHQEVQCMQFLEEDFNSNVEIVLINEGSGSNDSYTFHMHGYSMQVLGSARAPPGLQRLSRELFHKWDAEGKVQRNTLNPPLKDTITVPNKGFTIVRLTLNNKGAWLLECRACALSALPVAVLVNVPEHVPKSVTAVLPKCGSFRPPDVLLN